MKEGRLRKITSRFVKETVFFLFNDVIVYAYDVLRVSFSYDQSLNCLTLLLNRCLDLLFTKARFHSAQPGFAIYQTLKVSLELRLDYSATDFRMTVAFPSGQVLLADRRHKEDVHYLCE